MVQTVHNQVVGKECSGKPWSTTYMLSSDPITVEVSINGKKLGMEVDTGPAVSLVPETVCKQLWSYLVLQPSSVKLKTFWSITGGERSGTSKGQFEEQKAPLPLLVIAENGPCLVGTG